MKEYDLSIIVPAYNCEKYIERCLQSIFDQKSKNSIEIIIVNDGSKDKTLEKCEKFVYKYPNIKIINQNNSGVSYSRNIGVEQSSGKYVMFVDADDYLEKESLEDIEKMKKEDIDVLRYSYIIKNKNKKTKIIFDRETFDLEKDRNVFLNQFFRKTNQNIACVQVIRRDLLRDIKFNNNLFYGEDLLFNCQLYGKCKHISYTNTILYNYMQNEDSITRNYKNSKVRDKIENLIYIFEKIISENGNSELLKIIENKFIGEIVPQIMMLTFDHEIYKEEIFEQFKAILNKAIFIKIFKDINENELTMCKYKAAYKFMKNNNFKKLYLYSKFYKHLKMIQRVIKNL